MTKGVFFILSLLLSLSTAATNITLKIVDEQQQSLVGAHVFVNGEIRCMASKNGEAALTNVKQGDTLSVKFLGYGTYDKTLSIKDVKSVLPTMVALHPEAILMDTVVMTAETGMNILRRKLMRGLRRGFPVKAEELLYTDFHTNLASGNTMELTAEGSQFSHRVIQLHVGYTDEYDMLALNEMEKSKKAFEVSKSTIERRMGNGRYCADLILKFHKAFKITYRGTEKGSEIFHFSVPPGSNVRGLTKESYISGLIYVNSTTGYLTKIEANYFSTDSDIPSYKLFAHYTPLSHNRVQLSRVEWSTTELNSQLEAIATSEGFAMLSNNVMTPLATQRDTATHKQSFSLLDSPSAIQKQTSACEYPFVFMDSPAKLFTMRQANEDYLSLYRLGVRELNKVTSPQTSFLIQAGASLLFLMPLTHEEGHRSVLTCENIGAVSYPYFFNKNMAAYVQGVRDVELQNLRDTKLPTYIRLHTSGVESDYALSLRSNALLSWGKEPMSNLWIEYFVRKINVVSYFAMGLFKVDVVKKEEQDELKRDIVGHDIYGAVRHLHRPGMNFYRYTAYDDLTDEEKRFVKRVGWRSLVNLIDPVFWCKNGFTLKGGDKVNFALGYNMTPFGDFIDQHFWWATHRLNMHFYLREYENKQTWFPAAGVEFSNLQPFKRLLVDAALHGWQQPTDLAFMTSRRSVGGAIDATLKYKLSTKNENVNFSLNVGLTAKTQGYLLEEMALGNHVGLRFGVSLWIK